jgi:integrase
VDAPATIIRSLATLSKILRVAADQEGARLLVRLPKIKRETGEKEREFVLTREDQPAYLAACPDPLRRIAALTLETGLRLGEALGLTWDAVTTARVKVLKGKSKAAKRDIPLTPTAAAILERRRLTSTVKWIFPNEAETGPRTNTGIGHQHAKVRTKLALNEETKLLSSEDFVIHSLRHTALTRFAESGEFDVFTLKRIAGHVSLTTTERCIHPSDETSDLAMKGYGARKPVVVSLSAHQAENRP